MKYSSKREEKQSHSRLAIVRTSTYSKPSPHAFDWTLINKVNVIVLETSAYSPIVARLGRPDHGRQEDKDDSREGVVVRYVIGLGGLRRLRCFDRGDAFVENVGMRYFRPNLLHKGSLGWHVYFFFCFLGGVMGLPVFMPP